MKEGKIYCVYIVTNKKNGVLYTGVTGDLSKRMYAHKYRVDKTSFTAKYGLDKLVFLEEFYNPTNAIRREKQIKAGSRNKKIMLIEKKNPSWEDLSNGFDYGV